MKIIMRPALLLFICCCSLLPIFGESQTEAPEKSELKLVQVFWRHGNRNPTPKGPYPNDPYKDESNWPEGFGQLTKVGKNQHFKKGQFLRRRYKGFLSDVYNPYEIHVKSSDVDRTLMSAESNLAGLFPPNDPLYRWNNEIAWTPIPVHAISAELDNTLDMKRPCPKYKALYEEVQKSDDIKKVVEENADLFAILNKYTGIHITTPEPLSGILNALQCEIFRNYTLPEWTKEIFPKYTEKMTELVGFRFGMWTFTQEMKKLHGGAFIGEILKNIQDKASGEMDARKKFLIFSAHDTTVAAFLDSLGMFNKLPPPYAAHVIVELHFNPIAKNHFVQFLFHNDSETTTDHVYDLSLPGCGTPCLLEEFARLARPVIPKNWDEECKIPAEEPLHHSRFGPGLGQLWNRFHSRWNYHPIAHIMDNYLFDD